MTEDQTIYYTNLNEDDHLYWKGISHQPQAKGPNNFCENLKWSHTQKMKGGNNWVTTNGIFYEFEIMA